MAFRISTAYKNIRRLNQIVVALIKYGFGGIASDLRAIPFFPAIERIVVSRKAVALSEPERIRLVLEELGPTFIKLGQIASTRADLFPPEWVNEFKKLQDMVPPFGFEDVKKTVEGALGSPLASVFSSFDQTPVASASIAQVHYATLIDGAKVAVKVRRPGIERIIDADISVMNTVAGLLERYVPASRNYRPLEVVEEFERIIKDEQDLAMEGSNMERFKELFKAEPGIEIPGVYWRHTTRDILTMQRVAGTPIDEVESIRQKGIDLKASAIKGIELFFKQVFDFGVFHADLHPGNILIRDDGVIIYLDFGIVGRLDRKLRSYLASMLFSLVRKDYHGMAKVHRDMGLIGKDVNLEDFEDALRGIAEPIYGRSLGDIDIGGLLVKLVDTARRFDMKLQPNLLLLQKSMVIIEGVGRQLYPEVNMWEVARPLIYRWIVKEKLSKKALLSRAREGSAFARYAFSEVPMNLNSVLKKTIADRLMINFRHQGLDPLSMEIEGAARRVALGLVAGALIVAASIIVAFSGSLSPANPLFARTSLGVPMASTIAFVLALILGLFILVDSRRKRGIA
jgi:ubiquinone biosynthesis protein